MKNNNNSQFQKKRFKMSKLKNKNRKKFNLVIKIWLSGCLQKKLMI